MLAVMEGATGYAAVCQTLFDDLTGLGPDLHFYRGFVIDGSKALLQA